MYFLFKNGISIHYILCILQKSVFVNLNKFHWKNPINAN